MLRTVCLPVVLVASCLAPGAVGAEGEEAILTNRLLTAGIDVSSVMTSAGEVTVEYSQPVAELNSVFDVLQAVGTILAAVSEEMPSAQTCVVVQHFDDGQIMQVIGTPSNGAAFTGQRLSPEEFMATLEFRALTRGPMLVPGQCEPGSGQNCANCAECACYPEETCDPGNPRANERGCVVGAPPANAHLVGSEYVCDDGYEWNEGLSACVPVKHCPPHSFSFDGECHCESGYEWNAAGTECVPVQGGGSGVADSGSTTAGGNVLSKLKDLLDAIVNWFKSLF
jgi:hypothetical protein